MPKIKLVALSGWAVPHQVWEPLATALPDFITLEPLVLPGYGVMNTANDVDSHSMGDETIIELYEHPQALAAYLKRFLDDQVWVLGWSFGGQVASWLAYYYPSQIQGLITVASNPCFVAPSDEQAHRLNCSSWPGMHSATFARFNRSFESNMMKTLDRFYSLVAGVGESVDRDLYRWLRASNQYTQPSKQALASSLQSLATWDTRECLQQLLVPQHHCFADNDQLVPKELVSHINKKLANHTQDMPSQTPQMYALTSLFSQQGHGLPWTGSQLLSKKIVDVISCYSSLTQNKALH